ALTGTLDDGGFLPSPPSARWVDPVIWRRNGLLITRTALLMRRGRLTRTLTVVPHERTQSLAIQQGPWERRLGLADLRADSVPGPISPLVPHLPAGTAGRVLFEQAARARVARSNEGPEEWMRRVGVAEPEAVPEAEAATEPEAGP
ncbi:MAG: PH domain-containing protein, partial [Actinobacteria bacterium]|nr:PH domain-containing protein [Actinomycetota bacterium]